MTHNKTGFPIGLNARETGFFSMHLFTFSRNSHADGPYATSTQC